MAGKRGVDITGINTRVSSRIKRASELPSHPTILLYGRSGRQKTRTSATAPNPLIIDINEKGTASVERDLDPFVYQASLWGEIDDCFWFLESGDHSFETVVVDGVTSMQALCMRYVLGDEASRDASRDPDMPTRQAWGKVGELMKHQITRFRNLPMNVVFTALQRSRDAGDDAEGDDLIIGPSCSPGVLNTLEPAVDIIGHMSVRQVRVKVKKGGKIERVTRSRCRMRLGPSERYMTKDRYNLFGDIVESPNLTEVITAIKEAKK